MRPVLLSLLAERLSINTKYAECFLRGSAGFYNPQGTLEHSHAFEQAVPECPPGQRGTARPWPLLQVEKRRLGSTLAGLGEQWSCHRAARDGASTLGKCPADPLPSQAALEGLFLGIPPRRPTWCSKVNPDLLRPLRSAALAPPSGQHQSEEQGQGSGLQQEQGELLDGSSHPTHGEQGWNCALAV